jgi:hypothetical protein
MLYQLLRLRQKETSLEYDRWYWYDTEVHRDWDSETRFHRFFVVHYDVDSPHSGRIICDDVLFEDSARSGFDPDVTNVHVYESPFEYRDPFDKARTRFWYRKFYTETQMGRLMALRTDEPRLFEYQGETGTGATCKKMIFDVRIVGRRLLELDKLRSSLVTGEPFMWRCSRGPALASKTTANR